MRNIYSILFITALVGRCSVSSAAPALDVPKYIAQRGWMPNPARSPKIPATDIAAVMYFQKDSNVPSCGLIFQNGIAPEFVDILSAQAGEDYPHCVNINDVAAFELDRKPYLVFEYINRDTRDDLYREFFYVYKDKNGQYVVDRALNDATASGGRPPFHSIDKIAPRANDGAQRAKAIGLSRTLSGIKFLSRDFLPADNKFFATYQDKANMKCTFVVDTSNGPANFNHELFSEGDKCSNVLASGKLEIKGVTYYIAMFKGANKTHLAVISVSGKDVVTAEKEVAIAASKPRKPATMKDAKAALTAALK